MIMYLVGLALFLVLQMVDVISTTVSQMIMYKATFWQAFQAFVAIFPSILNRSLVVAVPFGVLLGFSRLQRDSEIKALLASGLSPLSLVWPLILPFSLIGLLAFWNASTVTPVGMQKWNDTWYGIYGMSTPIPSQEKYTYAPANGLYYASRVTSDESGHSAQLSGVMVQLGDKTYTAQSGVWDSQNKTWTLYSPWIVRSQGHPRQLNKAVILQQGDSLKRPAPEADKISNSELRRQLSGKLDRDTRRTYQHQLTSRYADPFTPVAFALAAAALGLLIRNRAAAMAAVLVMIAVFYVLWSMMPKLAIAGALAPQFAAWVPSLILLSIGGVLMFGLRGTGVPQRLQRQHSEAPNLRSQQGESDV